MEQELSNRAYAKHLGVSESSVRKAIKQGRVTKNHNGKINPKVADQEWLQNSDPAQIKATINQNSDKQNPDNSINQKSDNQKSGNSKSGNSTSTSTYQQSRAIREAYNARLAKLQFEKESKKLIPADEVKISAFNAGRRVRDRILNVPDRVIPNLIGKTDIFEMKEILKLELIKALEELSSVA